MVYIGGSILFGLRILFGFSVVLIVCIVIKVVGVKVCVMKLCLVRLMLCLFDSVLFSVRVSLKIFGSVVCVCVFLLVFFGW